MKLLISIEKNSISLKLWKNGKKVDALSFPDEHNLGRKLLPEIDKILKRNKLVPENIKETELISDLSDNFTTRRIAEAVKNAFNWHPRS